MRRWRADLQVDHEQAAVQRCEVLAHGVAMVDEELRRSGSARAAVAARLEMTLEGTSRGAWLNGGVFHDEQVWALLRSDHLARRSGGARV